MARTTRIPGALGCPIAAGKLSSDGRANPMGRSVALPVAFDAEGLADAGPVELATRGA
jgi:hypothetical protein